ncbi:hypothetical protein SRHO_G00131530 [Serrasalmus rhombeus]
MRSLGVLHHCKQEYVAFSFLSGSDFLDLNAKLKRSFTRTFIRTLELEECCKNNRRGTPFPPWSIEESPSPLRRDLETKRNRRR